jgi:hypothetical protein
VNAAPIVDACANCGAPLDLDETGACRWCHAHIHKPRAAHSALEMLDINDLGSGLEAGFGYGGQFGLVPDDVDDCMTSAPFLFLALSTLGSLLGTEPVVRQYMRGQPQLLQQIRALTTAVSNAGVRVRDAGLLKDDFDDNLAVYTHQEIWTFNLAFDVIAVIGALDGLPGQARAKAASDLRSLDEGTRSHAWKHAIKKANEGPVPFPELRAQVPHRA